MNFFKINGKQTVLRVFIIKTLKYVICLSVGSYTLFEMLHIVKISAGVEVVHGACSE